MPLPGKEFALKSWTDENRLVLRPSGSLNWEEGDELRNHVKSCELRELLIIDLTDVAIVSSGGMAALIDIFTYLRPRGIRLQIWCPNTRVREVLETAHLDRLLDIQPVTEPTGIFIEVRSVNPKEA
jgi:anti-anti-sigma factor